jgi:Lon protease-like protein
MAANPFAPEFEALPVTLPVFPLSGVALLPLSDLQLNIFEPRYVNMITDALGAGRMVGIVQPNTSMPGNTLYKIGCAGRITIFNETSDGRFLINLTGVCRFGIVEEMATIRGYRRVVVDWEQFRDDLQEEYNTIETGAVLQSLYQYFEFNNIQVDLDALRKMPGPKVVNFLSTHLPFEPEEKQALVETETLSERLDRLVALVKTSMSTRLGSTQTRH